MAGIRSLDITQYVQDGQHESVARKAVEKRAAFRAVFKLLYHEDLLTRHQAAMVLGRVAVMSPNLGRTLQERLSWAMNDESGTYCNGAAAAMAEVALVQPDTLRGFVPVLLSHLDDVEEEHIAQVLWAIGRLAAAFPRETEASRSEVMRFLGHEDASVRAMAARAIIRMKVPPESDALKDLMSDPAEVEYVECNQRIQRSIRDLILRETLTPGCPCGRT